MKIFIKIIITTNGKETFMKKDMKFNVFYGTEDFTKLFDNLIEDKIKGVTENIKNSRCNIGDKYYSYTTKEMYENE